MPPLQSCPHPIPQDLRVHILHGEKELRFQMQLRLLIS